MFCNYAVVLDQCGSSRGHRIRDKRCIFIPREVPGRQLGPKELSVPPLFPLHLSALTVRALEANDSPGCSILITLNTDSLYCSGF